MTFTDDFNRASSIDLGADWVEIIGDASVNDNTVIGGSPGEGLVRAVPAASSADHEIEAEVLGGRFSGVVARYAKPDMDTVENANFYMFRYSSVVGAWQLWAKAGSTWTELASLPEASPGTSYTARLRVQGSTITGFHGATQKIQVTDTRVTAGTRGGLYYGFDGSFDNFSIRSLA